MANFLQEQAIPLNYRGRIHQWVFSKKKKLSILNIDKILINKLEWEEITEIFATIVKVKNCDVETGLFLSSEEISEQRSIRLPVNYSGIGNSPSLTVNLLARMINGLEWEKQWTNGKSRVGKSLKTIEVFQNPDTFSKQGGILVTVKRVKF